MFKGVHNIIFFVEAIVRRNKVKGVGKGVPTLVVASADEGTWWIGKIQKMKRKVGIKWGIFH